MSNVELRKFKHYPRLSQETNAFSADVYIDGKKVGTAENRGHGDPINFQPWEIEKQLNEIAKKVMTAEELQFQGVTLDANAEMFIGGLVEDLIVRQQLEKDMKKVLLYIKDDKCYHAKGSAVQLEVWKKQYLEGKLTSKIDILLNVLPIEEAVVLFKKHAG